MNTKIQDKKVLYEGGRIICDGQKMTVPELIKLVKEYLICMSKLKELKSFAIDQEKVNFGIRVNLFKIPCTIGKLFELYNEIAEIEGLTKYDKIWYNPKQSSKFSPSKVE